MRRKLLMWVVSMDGLDYAELPENKADKKLMQFYHPDVMTRRNVRDTIDAMLESELTKLAARLDNKAIAARVESEAIMQLKLEDARAFGVLQGMDDMKKRMEKKSQLDTTSGCPAATVPTISTATAAPADDVVLRMAGLLAGHMLRGMQVQP